MWYVYILQSIEKKRYYIGHTDDVDKRVNEHNKGRTKSLKAYIPMKIVYVEEAHTKQDTFKRELQIKKYKGGNAFKQLLDQTRRDGRVVERGGLENR